MPPVPRLSGPQVERILVRNGFELRRVRGSHARYSDGDYGGQERLPWREVAVEGLEPPTRGL